MKMLFPILFISLSHLGCAQNGKPDEGAILAKLLEEPLKQEIDQVLTERKRLDLSPQEVVIADTVNLSNGNLLYVFSHTVEGLKHYGAVIVPGNSSGKKLPVVIFTTGGNGIHKEFYLSEDFNHKAVQYPSFLGAELDKRFIVVVPSFRGQQLIIGNDKYQSEGNVADAFDGAATDALALLNLTLHKFREADKNRIAIYGGSRGGAVALLAASRDNRIVRVIVVAAPTDMKQLAGLYPEQFRILFLNDLLAGEITASEARKKYIASSPIFFSNQLPAVQLHQDNDDPIVPTSFAIKLINQMKSQRKTITPYFYDEGIHGYWEDDKFWTRVTAFLKEMEK